MKIRRSRLNEIISQYLNEDVEDDIRGAQVAQSLPILLKLSRPGQKTLASPSGETSDPITPDSSREGIVELQRVLFSLRYNIGRGGPVRNGIDGQFGPSTKKALKKFRQDKGLSADLPEDQVGPEIAKSLIAAIKKLGQVAAADDKRPPTRPAMKSKEDIPLEKVQGLPVVDEPYAIDPQLSPADEPWTTTARQDVLTREWDKVEPETKNFVSAMPAAMASLGVVDKGDGDGESEAKLKAASVISSIYRGPYEQARAMYNGPYYWELAVRKQVEKQGLTPAPAKGDYYFSRTLEPDVIATIDAAVKAVGGTGFEKGVYREGGWATKVYKIFEKLTGGDLDNREANTTKAIAEAEPIIAAAYEKKPSGHAAGDSIDLSTKTFSQAQLKKIIPRIEQISGVDFNVSGEADHFHISLAESIYDALYEED